ncbi:MAG: 3'-5' exonuclease [Patescibacteria group bacterium]
MKKHNLAFIDLETTGLDPMVHEIIEIGGIVARQISRAGRGAKLEIVEEFEFKIKPEHLELAEPEALRINGYNEMEWLFAPDLKKVLETVSGKLKDSVMVAQNVTFDWSFLNQAFKKTGLKNPMHYHKLDLISLAFAKLYDNERLERFSLQALSEHFGIKNEKAHTALADIRVTVEIYKKLLDA